MLLVPSLAGLARYDNNSVDAHNERADKATSEYKQKSNPDCMWKAVKPCSDGAWMQHLLDPEPAKSCVEHRLKKLAARQERDGRTEQSEKVFHGLDCSVMQSPYASAERLTTHAGWSGWCQSGSRSSMNSGAESPCSTPRTGPLLPTQNNRQAALRAMFKSHSAVSATRTTMRPCSPIERHPGG